MFFDQPQNRMSFMDVPKWNNITAKGQTNPKWYFEADVSSKKWTNKFDITTSRLVFVCFLEESEDTKKIFRNELTFRNQKAEVESWIASTATEK